MDPGCTYIFFEMESVNKFLLEYLYIFFKMEYLYILLTRVFILEYLYILFRMGYLYIYF